MGYQLAIVAENLAPTRRDALVRGERWFYTGKPCLRGHLAARPVSSSTCMACHREKTLKEYRDNPAPKIASIVAADKMRRLLNPEKVREKDRETMRAWRSKNRESALSTQRLWRFENRDRLRAKARASYAENPIKHQLKVKGWRTRNPEKVSDQFKKWSKENPDLCRAKERNRRARHKNAEGRHTATDVLKIRTAQDDLCNTCHVDLNGKGHVDHIIALVRGGSNWPNNLQLLCAACNCSKGAKLPHEI